MYLFITYTFISCGDYFFYKAISYVFRVFTCGQIDFLHIPLFPVENIKPTITLWSLLCGFFEMKFIFIPAVL